MLVKRTAAATAGAISSLAGRAGAPHRSSSRQEASSSSAAGWPTTTSNALARVTATLKRRGAAQKPSWASPAGVGGVWNGTKMCRMS